MKKIFIAATKQNDGKTTVSLGLIANLKPRFKEVAFIKPIGQRYLEEEGLKIDEDSVLIEEVCGIKRHLKDMSPVAVEKGFTEKYITHPDRQSITSKIKGSYKRVALRADLVVIEGTGHAGVGSVFDHSNASVAKLLNSKVVIISSGGIGRPIDEVVLNKALFDKQGVKLLGVIINKVLPEKFDKINNLIRKGLRRKGIEVLGIIPYKPFLSYPKISQIIEETDFELLSGNKSSLSSTVSRIIVGAMEPHNAIPYIVDDSLLVTPGDREDMIMTALSCFRDSDKNKMKVSGLVLSGGIVPHKGILNLLREKAIPVLLSRHDTYTTASILHDINIKIRPQDKKKIQMIVGLIRNYVDIDKILKGL